MKRFISLMLSIFLLEIPVFSSAVNESQYLSYSTRTEQFVVKRLSKKYVKRIYIIENVSKIPLEYTWIQSNNEVIPQEAFNSTQFYSTIGSQCVAFLGGATIIGAPFAIHGACEMVKNKNAVLLKEINSFINCNPPKETIIKPNERIEFHVIEEKNIPAHIKVRFENKDNKIIQEVNCQ